MYAGAEKGLTKNRQIRNVTDETNLSNETLCYTRVQYFLIVMLFENKEPARKIGRLFVLY